MLPHKSPTTAGWTSRHLTRDHTSQNVADPGNAELQLGIVMADPGNAELQLGILGWPPDPNRGHPTPITRTALPRADNSKFKIEN